MKTLSSDLRERILAAYDRDDGTRLQIAHRFDVSLGMVKKLIAQRQNTGDIGARHRFSGRKSKLTDMHHRKLRELVEEHSDKTLEELRPDLGVACSLTAIHNAPLKIGLSYKKRHSTPQSRNVQTSQSVANVGRKT